MLQQATNDPRPVLLPHFVERSTDSLMWSAVATAARIRWLVAHHDGGDVCAAARRLSVPVSHLVRLESTLDGGEICDALLCAVVRRYGVGAAWLLTGCDQPEPGALPHDVRDRLARLLVAVAANVVEEYEEAHG